MTTVSIRPHQDVVRTEIQISAPPARVFQAITDPRQMLQWWGEKGMYRVTKFDADLRVGGQWMSSGPSGNDENFHVGGEYLEIDPPRTLVYTWKASWTGALTTTVRWELKPLDGGTLVTIEHSGFAGNADAANRHGQGWQKVLSWIQAFVEKGATIDSRS